MNSGVSVGSLETITLAQNSTTFSQTIVHTDKSKGVAGMYFTISAGSVTISQQAGFDWGNGLFYDPVDSNNAALGVVCTTFSAGTYYVQYDPVLAPFARFKCVEANVASTTITLRPVFWEDR